VSHNNKRFPTVPLTQVLHRAQEIEDGNVVKQNRKEEPYAVSPEAAPARFAVSRKTAGPKQRPARLHR